MDFSLTQSEGRGFVFVHDVKGFAAQLRDGQADGLVPGRLQSQQFLYDID